MANFRVSVAPMFGDLMKTLQEGSERFKQEGRRREEEMMKLLGPAAGMLGPGGVIGSLRAGGPLLESLIKAAPPRKGIVDFVKSTIQRELPKFTREEPVLGKEVQRSFEAGELGRAWELLKLGLVRREHIPRLPFLGVPQTGQILGPGPPGTTFHHQLLRRLVEQGELPQGTDIQSLARIVVNPAEAFIERPGQFNPEDIGRLIQNLQKRPDLENLPIVLENIAESLF